MTVLCIGARLGTCSPECYDGAHAHVRCEECSMPGYWTSIHFERERSSNDN